jgi:hypothetical protein
VAARCVMIIVVLLSVAVRLEPTGTAISKPRTVPCQQSDASALPVCVNMLAMADRSTWELEGVAYCECEATAALLQSRLRLLTTLLSNLIRDSTQPLGLFKLLNEFLPQALHGFLNFR